MVSIVITCYNYGNFIAECIDSVLKQTYKDTEIIIVNDGSTDNTEEVLQPYLALSNVHYIKQINSGQTVAKNTGIRHAKGDFIAFLDADDFWHPQKLEKQLSLFTGKIGVVYSQSQFVDNDSNHIPTEPPSHYLRPHRGDVKENLIFDNFIPFSSSVVRRECFDLLGTFDESLKMGIDWDLWLRFSVQYHFDYVEEKLLYYRVGHSNQMSKNVVERFSCADRILEKLLKTDLDYVSEKTLKKVYLYNCCNRGANFRQTNLRTSFSYYGKALAMNPFNVCIYKGILKNCIRLLKR